MRYIGIATPVPVCAWHPQASSPLFGVDKNAALYILEWGIVSQSQSYLVLLLVGVV
jgi:hypothetical protein